MNREVYSYLFRTYGRQPGYWLGVAALIIQALLMRVVSVIVIAHLAASIAAGNFDTARTDILIYLAVTAGGLIMRLIRDLIAIPTENKVYNGLMVNLYKKLVGKDMSFYRDNQTGYLAGVFRQHVDSSMELARLFRTEAIQTTISLTVPATVLIVVSWKVGLAALAVIIAQIIYVFWSSSIVHRYRAKSHEIYRQVSGTVSDDVTNIVAYKTSGNSQRSEARMQALADEEQATFTKRRTRLAFYDAPREFITVLGTAAAFWIIVSGAESTSTTVGLVVLTISYMIQIFNNVTMLPDIIVRHDDLITRMHPTLEYMTSKYESIQDPAKPQKLKVAAGRIDIEDVSFSYAEDKNTPVFKGLNLHIKGGEQVGVVGLSGAGKSTLASLLMRFDDIDGGSIKIDGTDIRDVRQEDLRSQIAYVPQEPLLFHRTIRENLQYFGKDMTEKHMFQAAKAAHAEEFIAKLPNGYDTMVGERGVKLSGGQKQRVVIARAILKNAPIMLFDEATSALDSESEKIIQKALPEILGKRTAVIIAHRLSTIAGLDRIIVMHDGRIIEDGTHAQLLKLKGRYYSLWQKQTNHGKTEK